MNGQKHKRSQETSSSSCFNYVLIMLSELALLAPWWETGARDGRVSLRHHASLAQASNIPARHIYRHENDPSYTFIFNVEKIMRYTWYAMGDFQIVSGRHSRLLIQVQG